MNVNDGNNASQRLPAQLTSESPIMKLPLEILQQILLNVLLNLDDDAPHIHWFEIASDELSHVCCAFRSAMLHVQLQWLKNCIAEIERKYVDLGGEVEELEDDIVAAEWRGDYGTDIRMLHLKAKFHYATSRLAQIEEDAQLEHSASRASDEESGTHEGQSNRNATSLSTCEYHIAVTMENSANIS